MHRNIFLLLILIGPWINAQDMRQFQTPFERFTLAAQNCNKVITERGSLIYFETGGFPEELDSVTITFREFFSPADMIIHDITMHTQAGGDPYQLASTGMFEIYALRGEDTINYNPSKRMAIYLASTSEQLQRNVASFLYDQKNRVWKPSKGSVELRNVAEDDDLWGSSSISLDENEAFFDSFDFVEDEEWEDARQRRTEAFQIMNINSFGLHNYDYIIDGVEQRYLQPTFVTNTGTSVEAQVYIVYRAFNSVYYFPTYTWESQFSLLINKDFTLFSIDSEGNIWKYASTDFLVSNLTHGAPVTFTLEKMGIPDSKASFIQLAGL